MEYEILFEDNHLLVVYKSRGILSQSDISGKLDLLTMLKNYLKVKYNKPGEAYLGLVHRLDRNTSGVMVFAKTSKAAARLSKAIVDKEFVKKYHAIVEGKVSSGTLKDLIYKNEEERKSYVNKKGKEAVLHYSKIEEQTINNVKCTLIDIKLETGRFHQIRCQMANMGHPLFGDTKYGSKHNYDYILDCYSLSFPHPITKEMLTFTH